jgi:hypothetical protein
MKAGVPQLAPDRAVEEANGRKQDVFQGHRADFVRFERNATEAKIVPLGVFFLPMKI